MKKTCHSKPSTEKKAEPLLISHFWKQMLDDTRPVPEHLQEQVRLHVAPDPFRSLCVTFPYVLPNTPFSAAL